MPAAGGISSKSQKRRGAKWQSAVALPDGGRLLRDGELPRIVLNDCGAPSVTTDQAEIASAAIAGRILPARVFKSRIGDRHTPQTPFLDRLGRHVQVETVTETPPAHLLDRDPGVVALIPQGLWVERVGARSGWACPDYLVVTASSRVVAVEVKTHRSFTKYETRRKLAQVGAACLRAGMGYEVWCELSHDQKTLYDRVFALGRDRLDDDVHNSWLDDEIVGAADLPIPFGTLHASIDAPSADFLPAFWRLCWQGRLCIDWEKEFTDGALVRAHGDHCRKVGQRTTGWSAICGPVLEVHPFSRRGFA